jgi:hypothetical protein
VAAGVNRLEVRRIGWRYTELQPLGWPADLHLQTVAGRRSALAAATHEKALLEDRRRSLIVMSLKTGQLDLFEVASITALPPERVRSLSRGGTLRKASRSD